MYDEKGNLMFKGNFKYDCLNGEGIAYNKDGWFEKGIFKDDKLHGEGEVYDEQKQLRMKGIFKRGELKCGTIYRDDYVEKGTFKNNELNGEGEVYVKTGKLIEKGIFKEGKLNGKGIRYNNDEIEIGELRTVFI